MDVRRLLQHLAEFLGEETFELNEHGVLSLRFGEDIVIHLEADPDGAQCHFYSPLCRIPEDADTRLAILEALMKGNTFGKGTAGAVFGVDESQNELVLTRSFSLDRAGPEDVVLWLQEMVSVMDIWRKRLPELGADGPPAAEHSETELSFAIKV
jgi:hypothetical protein